MNQTTVAAIAVGGAIALGVGVLFKAPLWASIVLGATGIVVTKKLIDKASET